MAENLLNTAGGKSGGPNVVYNSNADVIGLKLDILGKSVNLHVAVAKNQARLADIVPLARTLCAKITDVVVEYVLSNAGHIPCCKGCASCCARYLVPLSVPEALRLKEEISTAPKAQRESIFMDCLITTRRILSQRPPALSMDRKTEPSFIGHVDLNRLSDWYRSLKLPCPFLHRDMCSIYQNRPLACREYFVKGSLDPCRHQQSIVDVVKIPVQMPNVLAQLASELEGTGTEAVILPLTFFWYEQNRHRAGRTWPAVMMVKRFLEIVKEMASKNSIPIIEFKKTTATKTHEQVISF